MFTCVSLCIGVNQSLNALLTTMLVKNGITQAICGLISLVSGLSMILSGFVVA